MLKWQICGKPSTRGCHECRKRANKLKCAQRTWQRYCTYQYLKCCPASASAYLAYATALSIPRPCSRLEMYHRPLLIDRKENTQFHFFPAYLGFSEWGGIWQLLIKWKARGAGIISQRRTDYLDCSLRMATPSNHLPDNYLWFSSSSSRQEFHLWQ